MSEMVIRHATIEDLDEIMNIYVSAREFMVAQGNPRQWAERHWPPQSYIERDIQNHKSYVCTVDDKIQAVFFFDAGYQIESTYNTIDGAWHGSETYGVVHRIASLHEVKGCGEFCLRWAMNQCDTIRIDTHPDNIPMQNLVKKLGYTYCGDIHVVEDPDIRYAYVWEK